LLQRPLLAAQLARPLQVFARLERGAPDGLVIAVAFDAEERNRLAGGGDAVGHLLRPAVLDADDDGRGDVRIRAGADQGAEVQVEVGAELQPPVRVRQRHGALDVVLDRLRGGVREVVDRQDDDVITHADAAVLAFVAPESGFAEIHVYQRLVLTLCTWRCSPLPIGFTTLPMSTPYLITVSPGL